MTNGFFKLQRRVFSHWLWEESRELSKFEAFLDLLQLAAFEPTKRIVSGSVINIPKGGIVASERFLSERWKWSRTKVRHFLGMLEADQMLKPQKDQPQTVLILCNYAAWNDSETTKRPPIIPQKDQTRTTGEPNIRSKEMEEVEEKTSVPTVTQKLLADFWEAYPKTGKARSSKKQVADAWKALPQKPTPEEIHTALNLWCGSEEYQREGGQFVPGAHLWLKNRKWECPPEPSNAKSSPVSRELRSCDVGI